MSNNYGSSLVEVSFSNVLCFKDKQILSFIATREKRNNNVLHRLSGQRMRLLDIVYVLGDKKGAATTVFDFVVGLLEGRFEPLPAFDQSIPSEFSVIITSKNSLLEINFSVSLGEIIYQKKTLITQKSKHVLYESAVASKKLEVHFLHNSFLQGIVSRLASPKAIERGLPLSVRVDQIVLYMDHGERTGKLVDLHLFPGALVDGVAKNVKNYLAGGFENRWHF